MFLMVRIMVLYSLLIGVVLKTQSESIKGILEIGLKRNELLPKIRINLPSLLESSSCIVLPYFCMFSIIDFLVEPGIPRTLVLENKPGIHPLQWFFWGKNPFGKTFISFFNNAEYVAAAKETSQTHCSFPFASLG